MQSAKKHECGGRLTVCLELDPSSACSPELTFSVTEGRGPMQHHETIVAMHHQLPAAIALKSPVAPGEIVVVATLGRAATINPSAGALGKMPARQRAGACQPWTFMTFHGEFRRGDETERNLY